MTRRIVIVGASVAGVRVARALRARGSTDQLLILGDEVELPYDKPALSKGVLAGRAVKNDNRLLEAAEAESLGVRLMLGRRATKLDLRTNTVETSAGPIEFDDLVIATGARARTLPWSDQPRIHLLRTQADSIGLREAMSDARRLLVVGGGFIGCEVAATARQLGLEVALVEPQSRILGGAGPEVADVMADLHSLHGVALRTGVAVMDVRATAGGIEAVLDDGTVLTADLAVVGVGAIPNTEWLVGSGLDLTDGVLCDPLGRVAHPAPQGYQILEHVYAVGDVARWHDPRTRSARRIEHWTNAVEQANVVARVIGARQDGAEPRGAVEAHAPTAYLWSDQYDWTLHLVGDRSAATDVVRVPTGRSDQLALIGAGADGRVVFGAVANWPRALITVRKAAKDGAHAEELREQLASLAEQPNFSQTKGAVA